MLTGSTADLAIALVVIIGMALIWMVGSVVHTAITDRRRRRQHVRPYGAVDRPRLPAARGTGGIVRVAFGDTKAPADGKACAAWSVEVVGDNTQGPADVMLRDGRTGGFEVVTDDGETIRVPAGRIRVDGRRTVARRLGGEATARLIASLPRLPWPETTRMRDDGGFELPAIPAQNGYQWLVCVGDRIELRGSFERREDPLAHRASPRDPVPTVLVPVGVPAVTVTRGGEP